MRYELFRQYIIRFSQKSIFLGHFFQPSNSLLFYYIQKSLQRSILSYHTLHLLQITSRTMCRPVIIVRSCISEYSILTTRSNRKAGPVDPEKPIDYEVKYILQFNT